jgi:Flavin reductase like domain
VPILTCGQTTGFFTRDRGQPSAPRVGANAAPKHNTAIRSPRILAAPAALVCRLQTTLQVGPAHEIILGEVVGVSLRSDAVSATSLHIDQQLMDTVDRMGGHTYARTRDQFDIKTLSPQEWENRREGGRRMTGGIGRRRPYKPTAIVGWVSYRRQSMFTHA